MFFCIWKNHLALYRFNSNVNCIGIRCNALNKYQITYISKWWVGSSWNSYLLFGPKKGAIAGAVGMGLFDLIMGWTLWAPFTILTRGLQGYIVGKITLSMATM